MMAGLISLLSTLNSLSPLAVIALLGLVIYIMVNKQPSKDDVNVMKSNDLHAISETLQRIELAQTAAFSTIIAKLNGVHHD